MPRLTRGAVAEPGGSLACHTGSWRDERPVHVHAAAPCHLACPAGEDAQAWIARLQAGDPRGAWEELVRVNPLPAITGRVCPHPCESRCNRGAWDTPVAIHQLERGVGDAALAAGWDYPGLAPLVPGAAAIAIVGAGPAGLACAYQLRRAGLRPVLFDAMPEAGGLLRSAIPPMRLPRSVLDAELERLLGCGLGLETRRALGRDFDLDELAAAHAAVFLAPGCQQARAWDVQGVVPSGCRDGLEMLKEWLAVGELPHARRVVVHGGGNTAMDIARVFLRRGAEEVHLVTASGLPGPGTATDDVVDIVPRELAEGLEEGVRVHPHSTLGRVLLRGPRTVGVELVSLRKLLRPGGARKRVAFEGTEQVIAADLVVPCIGERVDPAGLGELVTAGGFIAADGWGRVGARGRLYAGGDARGDRGTVAAAIGDGRRAALAIVAALADRAPEDVQRAPIALGELNLAYYEPAPRERAAPLALAERDEEREIDAGLDAAQARREAERCLSCGNCLACDNCWTLCPDTAVLKLADAPADGARYVFDYDYCKGCGLCARECPTGYIRMVPEPL